MTDSARRTSLTNVVWLPGQATGSAGDRCAHKAGRAIHSSDLTVGVARPTSHAQPTPTDGLVEGGYPTMRIAIAGFGIEGQASYTYYQNQGGHQLTVVDEREMIESLPDEVDALLGPGSFSALHDFDMVVRTAGLNPKAITTGGMIWSATNEFFAQCPAPIIGVTGTKGKGTTCSLIAGILRASGYQVHLVGNIGVPALGCLGVVEPNHVVVYELSSFQLWDLQKSPHIAVVLHVEADHLDVHADMAEYLRAKSNIARGQTSSDICYYHPTNEYSAQIAGADRAGGGFGTGRGPITVPYDTEIADAGDITSVHLDVGHFVVRRAGGEQSAIPISALQIPGAHNQQNACAAISAALAMGVSDDAITLGLESFDGLKHRLKYVARVADRTYYDDSVSTTPGSAIAAMRSFAEPKVMIFGGSAKGARFDELAEAAAASNVRSVLAIGAESDRVESALTACNVAVVNLGTGLSMDEIVSAAHQLSEPGDSVVLSPACASFDMFANYADRGDKFIAAVEKISRTSR